MSNELDNYTKLVNQWKTTFSKMSGKLSKARLLGLNISANTAEITYFGRSYRLELESGDITPLSGTEVPEFDAMFIYHLFWFSQDNPTVSGIFVPLREIPDASVFEAAFKKLALDRLSTAFSGKTDRFISACRALGGRQLPYGDAGFAVTVFGELEIELIFWDGDDEFPATANILFDKNIVHFTHAETVVQTGIDGVSAVIAAADL